MPCDDAATPEQLLDFDFYPWEKTVLATAGRDGIVKVWKIPVDGQLAMDLTAAEYYLAGHEKKVDLLKFHPTAADLLLTASRSAGGGALRATRGACALTQTAPNAERRVVRAPFGVQRPDAALVGFSRDARDPDAGRLVRRDRVGRVVAVWRHDSAGVQGQHRAPV